MALSPEALVSRRPPAHASLAWLRLAWAEVTLVSLIAASFVARLIAALPHRTPRYFPDEYIYASLARSLAHGRLTIRGTPAHFPALLEPLLAAPFSLAAGVETAYRMTQASHALAASLAAVPVFLLARRLELPRWQCLMCAAFTLALPELVYVSYLTADAIALPLALAAVYAAVVALERPTLRTQSTFVVLAGLATFARVQYVVVPVAFVVAAALVTRGRLRVAARRYRATLIALTLPVLLALVAGPDRALGYYRGVLHLNMSPEPVLRWIAVDSAMLVFACGAVLVPAALVGLWLGIVKPTTSAEHSFAAMTAMLAPLLLVELGLYAASGAERFQGRYLEALPPLLPILFCVGMRRVHTRAHRCVVAALSVGALILAARVPLSGYVEGLGKQDSPFLQAVWQLETWTSKSGGSLLIALVSGLLALTAAAAVLRTRIGTPVALALSVLFVLFTSVGAVSYDIDLSHRAIRTYFPDDVRWVDKARLGDVAVLVTPGSPRGSISGTLFWNTSATRLLQMRGAEEVDTFGQEDTRIGRDGTIFAAGKPYRGPLLVEEYAARAELEDATLVTRNISTSLWRTNGTPRLVTLTEGRYLDGWLAWKSSVTVWPGPTGERTGALCLRLQMPQGVNATVDVTAPGVKRTIALGPGTSASLALPVTTRAPWRLTLTPKRPILLPDSRVVTAKSSPPRFVEGKASAAACR